MIVLHPSLGRGASDFDDLSARLRSAGHRVVAFDPQPREGATLHDLAADVAAVIDEPPAHLIGHAFGNRVVRCVAADRPDLVASVTLLAAGGAVPMPDDVAAAMRRIFERPTLEDIATVFFAPGNDASVWLDGWRPDLAAAQAAAVAATPREDWWTAGSARVLVVQGLQDRCAVPENGRLLARELGGRCTLVELDGAGHALLPEAGRDRGRGAEVGVAVTLIEAIAEGLWETPHVELEIFGTADPDAIAASIRRFCTTELGADVADCLFFESSVGSVAGLDLADGRRVVLKTHQRWYLSYDHLRAASGVQDHLARSRCPVPLVILGPTELGNGYATVEAHVERGPHMDAHAVDVRTAMARALERCIATARRIDAPGLRSGNVARARTGALWPAPHSRMFDFEATSDGAGWIDDLGRRAQDVLRAAGGPHVPGHLDWSVKHIGMDADRNVHVVYDWDSLALDPEPAIVGDAARTFTATWYIDVPYAPSAEEFDAFVADYVEARGRPFDQQDMRVLRAAGLYGMAYSARCEHAGRRDDAVPAGTYRDALQRWGAALLG